MGHCCHRLDVILKTNRMPDVNLKMNHRMAYPHQKNEALNRMLDAESPTLGHRHRMPDVILKTNHRLDVGPTHRHRQHDPLPVWAHVFPNDSLWHSV